LNSHFDIIALCQGAEVKIPKKDQAREMSAGITDHNSHPKKAKKKIKKNIAAYQYHF
jgi:hypothetical protein